MRVSRLAVLLLLLVALAPAAAADRPHVYLVVVDGLDPRFLDPDRTPAFFAGGRMPGRAVAVMPTRTNPNHVALLTGTWPEVNGITGNAYWDRDPAHRAAKMDDPALIGVETLFTVAETDRPELVTAGFFAKAKLGRLFAAVPGRQRAPDELWSPSGDGPGIDPITRYADDATTMGALLAFAAEHEPDLAVVEIADVDRLAHGDGPASPEAQAAAVGAGKAVQKLVDALRAAGRWERSVVIVTADHGFDDVQPPGGNGGAIDLAAVLAKANVHGVRVVADGGVAHVYADGLPADARTVGVAVRPLAQAAVVARSTPGVWDVTARLDVPGVGRLAEKHPDWHLDHPRTGDLLVVAAEHWQLVDAGRPTLHGNHGNPGQRAVPLVITGGHPAAAALRTGLHDPSHPELGQRVAALLGLRPGRVLDPPPAEASPPPAPSAGAPAPR